MPNTTPMPQTPSADPGQRKAWLIRGGIGSLSAAALMIRDGGMAGANITILEALPLLGGSVDGAGNPENGYSLRGGWMLTSDNCECTWDLFRTIPSLAKPASSVYDETMAFNAVYKAHSMARLVDRHRAKVPVASMGFSMHNRLELLKLSNASEAELGTDCITDCLSPSFFETVFRYMWVTTFAFQPWHSAVEFKRYLHRFMLEFSRIETLAGVKRTVFNQYGWLVVPLVAWLRERGVNFVTGCIVTDLDHTDTGVFSVTGIRCQSDRPLPVPANSRNFAFVSQFVEIADDVVFTVEYSVRAAQMAVYQLLGIARAIPVITPHDKTLQVQFKALVKAFK